MASFLTSALGGVNNLSNLVDRVNQLKDNIERTLDNAVGEDSTDSVPQPAPLPSPSPPLFLGKTSSNPNLLLTAEHEIQTTDQTEVSTETEMTEPRNDMAEAADNINQDDDAMQQRNIEQHHGEEAMTAINDVTPSSHDEGKFEPPTVSEAEDKVIHSHEQVNVAMGDTRPGKVSSSKREKELADTLKRRELQLEKASRQLAEQEEQLNSMREALDKASADKRVRAAEAKAEGLMKEGLILAEKQGKAEQALRKVRKEKEDLEAKEKSLAEQLKKEQDAKAALESELNELRDVRKRGEASIAQIAESNADTARRLEEARAHVVQAERREAEMKTAMERTFAEIADQKKMVTSLTQQLNAAKREAEHAKFQLKEQLDSRQLHGSRADSMEKSLAEAKMALEEHVKESRQVESDLRAQLLRANELFRTAEKRAEEAAAKALELTTPLLRQIDLLNEQRAKTEESTSALLTRAVSAEAAEAEAIAGKRKAEQARSELAVRVSELESLLTAAKADASRAVSDCKIALKRADEAERERDAVQKAMDTLRSSTDAKIAEQRMTEMQLRQNLALEMEKFERTKRTWEERARDSEERHQTEMRKLKQQTLDSLATATAPAPPTPLQDQQHLRSTLDFSSPSPGTTIRRFPSDASSVVSSSAMTATQDEILGNVLYGEEFSNGGSSLHHQHNSQTHLATMDLTDGSSRYLLQASEMQAGIRRRDAKIKILTDQLDQAIKQKEELVNEVNTLQARVRNLEGIAVKEANLNREVITLQRQSTLLMELLGEKEEQIDALTSDLEDVKTKFREQLELLLKS